MAYNSHYQQITYKLPTWKREYYQRLLTKYGSNWQKMENDIKLNYFQWTRGKLKKEILFYKKHFKFDKKR